MTIDDLKSLKQVIKVLRDGGVTSAEIDGVKLTLLAKPISNVRLPKPDYSSDIPEAHTPVPQYTPVNKHTGSAFETIYDTALEANPAMPEELTEEQLLMWSVGNEQQ